MIKPDTTGTKMIHQGRKVLDVLIIGGGLSGMMLAHEIHRTLPSTTNWNLVEARPLLGGRLANDDMGDRIDLGGAWVWPDHQPNMRRLLQTKSNNSLMPSLTSISTFLQPDDDSSTRFDGGAVALIHALAKDLPGDNIRLNTPIANCTLIDQPMAEEESCNNDSSGDATTSTQKFIQVQTTEGESFLTKWVVLAVPPKLASKYITFDPPLSKEKQHALATSHTWMAGVTKIALVYPKCFWTSDMSNMGLPGGGGGPAFQVYDASTKDGSVHALTFFAMVPQGSPAATDDKALAEQVAAQMGQALKYIHSVDLSSELQSYTKVHTQRWPLEKYISEDAAPKQIHPHPHPVRALSTSEWGGRLMFAGSETDQRSPGVMEGAIGAAIRVLNEIRTSLQ